MPKRRPRAVAALALAFVAATALVLLPSVRTQSLAPAALRKPSTALRVLIMGGGPDKPHNQVAIESNVRYVRRLLPEYASRRVLFADGNPQTPDVQYENSVGLTYYRASQLDAVDDACTPSGFRSALSDLASEPPAPFLLYFTGHGSPDDGHYDDNAYDMWDDNALTVKNLARSLQTLPPSAPVTVVMVQCFSGAFGNLLFAGGDPQGPLASRSICGFFASVPDREAAGCTPEVDEADYHDFTSYFFAALSGRDRLGRPVMGADYNKDGMVGMDEAYAYTQLHDISIDTPTCTSDVFLRRFVPAADQAVFSTPYSEVIQWATPAQRAVLGGLSSQLHLSGEQRLLTAYSVYRQRSAVDSDDDDAEALTAHWIRFIRCAKSVILARQLSRSPDAALKARYAALIAAEARSPFIGRTL